MRTCIRAPMGREKGFGGSDSTRLRSGLMMKRPSDPDRHRPGVRAFFYSFGHFADFALGLYSLSISASRPRAASKSKLFTAAPRASKRDKSRLSARTAARFT